MHFLFLKILLTTSVQRTSGQQTTRRDFPSRMVHRDPENELSCNRRTDQDAPCTQRPGFTLSVWMLTACKPQSRTPLSVADSRLLHRAGGREGAGHQSQSSMNSTAIRKSSGGWVFGLRFPGSEIDCLKHTFAVLSNTWSVSLQFSDGKFDGAAQLALISVGFIVIENSNEINCVGRSLQSCLIMLQISALFVKDSCRPHLRPPLSEVPPRANAWAREQKGRPQATSTIYATDGRMVLCRKRPPTVRAQIESPRDCRPTAIGSRWEFWGAVDRP